VWPKIVKYSEKWRTDVFCVLCIEVSKYVGVFRVLQISKLLGMSVLEKFMFCIRRISLIVVK